MNRTLRNHPGCLVRWDYLEIMYAVGRRLPIELRETALGGCAAAPSACARCGGCG